MNRIAYFRVSTSEQSIESQRHKLGGNFHKEFADEGVSGSIPAKQRPGFAALLAYIREGDSLHVYAVDRLGRDAIDVQQTVRELLDKGVEIHIHGLGVISKGVGELIIAVLAQVADMERKRIVERTQAGRETAKKALAETGKTHNGKVSLGRPKKDVSNSVDRVKAMKAEGKTLAHIMADMGLSKATVCRYLKAP